MNRMDSWLLFVDLESDSVCPLNGRDDLDHRSYHRLAYVLKIDSSDLEHSFLMYHRPYLVLYRLRAAFVLCYLADFCCCCCC